MITNFFYKRTILDTVLISKDFELSNSIAGWTNSGFTINEKSISCQGANTISNYFRYSLESYLDCIKITATVKFLTTDTVFCLQRNGGIAGSFAKINVAQNKLIVCHMWNGADTPVETVTKNISFQIELNKKYEFSLEKNRGVYILNIKDETNSDKIEINTGLSIEVLYSCGAQWGYFGITHLNGHSEITKIKVDTSFDASPNYAIYGDSIVEGNTLIGLGNNYNDRWCKKLSDHIGKCVISGQGGASSAGLVSRFRFDFQKFTPKNTVIFIGANDSAYVTWLSNVQNMINQVVAKNSVPILCTILPRDDRQAFINQANAWILSSGYKIFDFAYVLTVNNDRITRRSNLFLSDNVHPNIAGHEIMYQECLSKL